MSSWWDTTAGFSSGVPFAVDAEGQWRDVEAVERGKACACYCAECQSPLIARQGEVRVHHFAHEDRRECRRALESSLYGMAVDILRQPGAKVRVPAPYCPDGLARAVGVEGQEIRRAMKTLSIADAGEREIVLNRPVATSGQVRESHLERPEVADEACGCEIHFLSSRKALPELERGQWPESTAVLAINPIKFAWRWNAVCDPGKEARAKAASTARDEFKEWLASTVEGRGWIRHPEERRVRGLVAAEIAAVREREAAAQARRRILWPPAQPPQIRTTPPVVAEVKDRVLRKSASFCYCGSPMDVVLFGTASCFAGKRFLVCQANPKHPVKHLG